MADQPSELFAVLLSLWRERQSLLESHAADLLTLPPAVEQPSSASSLHELLQQQPQHVALHPKQLVAASSSQDHSVHSLHARLERLDATIVMLRGAAAAAQGRRGEEVNSEKFWRVPSTPSHLSLLYSARASTSVTATIALTPAHAPLPLSCL